MPDQIALRGCAPEPLIHYLKALGVLRLVAEQLDPDARGAWRGDSFVLLTGKGEEALLNFFINDYRPTPIVAPWNGGSGFYPQDKNQRALIEALCRVNAPRLVEYQQTITAARRVVGGREEQPKDEGKAALLRQARREFPDQALEWLDAAFVLGEGRPEYPPLLGSGGNDGRFDFTINFIARLVSALPETIRQETFAPLARQDSPGPDRREKLAQKLTRQCEERIALSRERLHSALFHDRPAPLEKAAVGQFHPGGAGGANATQGVAGESLVNPWDFILAIEGTLMLASAAVRQLAAGARSKASFPFTVRNSAVGYGTATVNEKIRAELWLPLWSSFTGYAEILHVFREGRVQFTGRGDRLVRTGFDFARAVSELGVDRGIDAFQRYGFIERNGQSNLAVPLGRLEVREQPRAALVYQIDRWLEGLRRATRDAKRTPPRFTRARRQIEEAIFNLCATGGAEHLRATLMELGDAEAEIAGGLRFRKEHGLRPLRSLSERWVRESDDGSAEFELATALASIIGGGKQGPFRTNLEPVEVSGSVVSWATDDAGAVWGGGELAENLSAVLQRRSVDARAGGTSHPSISSRRVASLSSVDRFLRGDIDDGLVERLLRGLALVNWSNATPKTKHIGDVLPPTLARAYALLKLLFLPDGKLLRGRQRESVTIRHEPTVIPLLRAGRIADALEIAGRRLHATGLTPFTYQFHFPVEHGTRLAAALLIPVSEHAAALLANIVLRPEADEERGR